MRNYVIDDTENEFHVKNIVATSALLTLLQKHHMEVVIQIEADEPIAIGRTPLVEGIQVEVARSYKVTRAEMISDRRNKAIIMPRHVAMYLSKALTPRSLPAIARKFGDRDHSTVHYAIEKIEGMLSNDPKLTARVQAIRMRLVA